MSRCDTDPLLCRVRDDFMPTSTADSLLIRGRSALGDSRMEHLEFIDAASYHLCAAGLGQAFGAIARHSIGSLLWPGHGGHPVLARALMVSQAGATGRGLAPCAFCQLDRAGVPA